MRDRRKGGTGRLALAIAAAAAAALAAFLFRDEIQRTALDPKQPYQTYRPPPAPNYSQASAWALRPRDPAHPGRGDPPADIFFVHPTTYDGGKDWNAPVGEPHAERFLREVALPNYAGPFQRVGRVFAPRYRQASLYAFLTLRDDAREARRFAYGDVARALAAFLAAIPPDRPIVLAGVGQGAELLARLAADAAADPALKRRIAAVYLIDALEPAAAYALDAPLPACRRRDQARCVVGWYPAVEGDEARANRAVKRALVWNAAGELVALGDRPALCVNPLTGRADEAAASAKLNLGAVNATGLEWGVRPAFLPHQVSARCEAGLLRVSRPSATSLQPAGSWADRHKVAPYNLFYADTEADAAARVETLTGRRFYGPPAPAIAASIAVAPSPVHRID